MLCYGEFRRLLHGLEIIFFLCVWALNNYDSLSFATVSIYC